MLLLMGSVAYGRNVLLRLDELVLKQRGVITL
jgi:hypothetical protein